MIYDEDSFRQTRPWCLLLLGVLGGLGIKVQAAGPEPAGWYSGDIHVHRSCGGSPVTVSSIYNTMVSQDLAVVSLLADMGNGEVQNATTDLPLVNGTDASVSTAGRIVHWDAEWHWDAIYTQYPHQALGGHIVALGLTNATQIWNESTYSIFNWARQQGGIAGFAHFQYLDDSIPTSLSCCTPIEYPVEVALGACDFISEDVNGSESFIHAYYRLLNCGFRPGFAAGSDHPCAANIGTMLTYSQVAGGQLTYRNWIQGIKNGRTVVSRNGRLEFVDLKVNGTSGPGDEIQLTGGGNVTVNIQWTATQNLTGTLELVQNGAVVASKQATAGSGSPVSLSTTLDFTKSGWLCARRIGANGHAVHTAAVFVTVDGAPVRASASDAQFYVDWMDTLLQNTSPGGVWASYYPTTRVAAQARYTQAKGVFQQIVIDAGGAPPPTSPTIGNPADGLSVDGIWGGGAWINAGRFQSASNATVTTMRAKVGAISGKYKCAIYAGTSSSPGALLAGTAEVSGAADGWQTFPLTASVALTSGSYYWLAIWSDDANAKVYYSDSSGTLRWGQYNYSSWPASLSTSGGGSFNYCIYATGTAATLTSITVTPTSPTILAGATQQFTATGTYSDGSTQNVTSQATWASSSTAVATVSASGLALGISAGTTTTSAALAGKTGGTTLTVQAGPLGITTASLPNGILNAAYSATLAAGGGTAPYNWSIASGSLPPGLTLNSNSGAVTGTPTSIGTFNFTAQVRDVSNPIQTATKPFTVTITAAPAVATIWPSTSLPGVLDVGPDSSAELGVKFRSDVDGSVTGIRFYKATANTGTHVGSLWTSSGTLLGSATFTGETASGWQQVLFAAPVPLTANTIYVASYHANTGHYSEDLNYFSTTGVDNPPLHALPNGVSGGNGVYAYGASSAFPSQTYNSANYWVDVVFQAGAAPTLTGVAVTPTSATIVVGATQQYAATGTYSDGSTQNLTSQATWTSSNTAVATANPGGLVTGLLAGTTTISAALGGVNGSSTLTVQAAPVTITTAALPGGTMGAVYTAAMAASGGTTPYTWSVTGGALPPGLTLNTSGSIGGTPAAAGTFNFNMQVSDASNPMQTASKALSITIAPALASISVTPASPAFVAGATQQFTATGTYSDGSSQDVTSRATWVSSNTVVAAVSAGGLATGVSAGTTTIAAVMGAISGGTSVTILPPPEGLGDYRSTGSGVWNTAATWQTNNGTAWVAASQPPVNSSTAGVITIRSGHTITVASAVTVDQLLVQAGGQLTVNNVALTVANGTGTDLDVFGAVVLSGTSGTISLGSGATIAFKSGATYQHARSAGTIPTATWDTNSTCLVTGSTSALPGGRAQTFGHFTWNCASQSAALNLETSMNIAGNFTVSATGTGTLRLLNSTTARTMTVGGNYDQTGGTFNLKNSSGVAILNVAGNFNQAGGTFTLRSGSTTGSGTVNVAKHFSLSAGTFNLSSVGAVGTLNVGGNFSHTGGTLTETSTGSGAIFFTSGLHTNTSGGTLANAINFTVNTGATLMLGTSLLGNGSSGTFTLASGGTLGIGDPAGITTSGATGNIRVTGARAFNTGADYLYNGTVPQVPGNGLPATVNNLTIANAAGLTMNSTNAVNGTCTVSTGARLLGTGLINNGPVVLSGTVAPGVGVGRFTTARETWNGGASYNWEINNATGTPATGWDLLSLTDGQGIDLQAATTNPFTLKLITLNGSSPGLAANFNKTDPYTWTIAIATNATVTNFAAEKFVVDATQFSNDFGGGTFSFELSGSDLRLRFAAEPSGLTIGTTSLPNGYQNAAYAATLTAGGGITPYKWSIVGDSLPAGLALNAASGAITGTPVAVGVFDFTAGVSDSSVPEQAVTKSLSITVAPMLTSLTVTPANPSILTGGTQQFTATGTYSDSSTQNLTSLATWTSSSPAVATITPSGLATGLSAGTTTISALLAGVSNSALLTVQAPLVVATTSLPNGTVSTPYTTTLTASGGTALYTWSLASGLLPPGLTLNATSGAITGTPTVAGTSNLTVQVSDASIPVKTATKPLSITIAPILTSIAVTPANPTNVIGTTRQFTATGTYSDGTTQDLTSQATWTSSSPAVATINSSGLATGITAGSTTISATLGSVNGTTTLTIQPLPLAVTTISLPSGAVSTIYTVTLAATGGTAPYAWSLAGGALPTGLALSSSGVIAGTPTTTGTSSFTVRATDAGIPAQTATNLLSITINSAGTPGLIGNMTDGTLTDYLWYNGAWINAGRFQAASNMTVSAMQAKVGAITGKYKCAIYTDSGGQPSRLLRSTAEVSNPATGWQTFPLTSSLVLTNGQYYWLAIWSDNASAQVYYSGSTGTLRWQQVNYGNWPDPMAASGGGNFNYCIYATGLGPVFFGVASVTPDAGASGITLGAPVTVTFTAAMDASTINANTIFLRDSSNTLVPATVSYNSATTTATLTPSSLLKAATAYTATVKGGAGGVANLAGSKLSADFIWTFRTDMYGDGPGGPILILTQTTNAFSRYYAEILLTEGLNEFALTNISSISSAALANYDVIILGQTALTPSQVTMLSDWVNAGGKLIAMRPDKQLAGLLGLTDAGSTLAEGYLLVNTATGPGAGIVGQTIQFHGTADRYTLGTATSLATLYSGAQTSTVNPAVTLRSVGSNGGQAAAFAFDLARSIVYTRQGNPAWTDQNRDAAVTSDAVVRSDDLFYGAASSDPKADWVDLNKLAIPQADEQQRLLANMILSMNSSRKLLPRFWYFPHGHAAVVVMTGDDHGFPGVTAARFDQYLAASPSGGSVDDWETVRSASYVFPYTTLTAAQATSYNAAGFEIGVHLTTGCANYTRQALDGFFADQLSQFRAAYPSLPSPTTHRMHCIAWSGYTVLPEVGLTYGIRLDTSYYFYPPTWVADRPGLFTGSGMAMRFAATNGNVIDAYQAATQMTDESGQSYPYTVDTLLDRALGPEGYYGAFVANMHTDSNPSAGSDAILSSALSRGVPIISARQLLTWLDARNSSSIKSINWNNGSQTFSIEASAAAKGLQVMLPIPAGYNVSETRFNGSPIAYSLTVIKGIRYVFAPAATGSYQVSYIQDTMAPAITSTVPANGATAVGRTTEVRVTFSEAMDPSTINTNTILLLDSAGNGVTATVSYDPSNLTAVLRPSSSLRAMQTYSAGVEGGATGVKDFAGNARANDFVWTFVTAN